MHGQGRFLLHTTHYRQDDKTIKQTIKKCKEKYTNSIAKAQTSKINNIRGLSRNPRSQRNFKLSY